MGSVTSLSQNRRSIPLMQADHGLSEFAEARPALPSTTARAGKAVLVVSVEPFVRELLSMHLRAAGCFPMAVATLEDGQRLTAQMVPDLIVLDIDVCTAGTAGSVWTAEFPSGSRVVRKVMLTVDVDRCCGSDRARCGADLCVSKPFEPRELMRQLLRMMRPARAEEQRPRARPVLRAPAIQLDRQQPTVRLLQPGGWQALNLPWTEHRLLAYLLADTTRAHSREAIRDAVWSDEPVDLRTVDQYVRRLRRTLEAAGARDLVTTVKGFGYALDLQVLQRLRD